MSDIKYFDAHTHLDADFSGAYTAAVSASNPEEWRRALDLKAARGGVFLTFGAHPWTASAETASRLREFLPLADALGEIGMDSVWTDTDLGLQREVFITQLDLARELSMPVVLHTKGCEAEIAAITARYALRYLVHWYSGEEICAEFLRGNYFFTVGCDIDANPAVANVARRVPLERLTLETDGAAATAWAGLGELPPRDVLRNTARAVAAIKGVAPESVLRAAYRNAARFYGARS
ncbi:MAG: TatD family hydrolase [Oscillospiraceae bacterium]|jgi:TatD DNase family protein|nr:TatD family hydrolase [Oscillospiraceae bacterium]